MAVPTTRIDARQTCHLCACVSCTSFVCLEIFYFRFLFRAATRGGGQTNTITYYERTARENEPSDVRRALWPQFGFVFGNKISETTQFMGDIYTCARPTGDDCIRCPDIIIPPVSSVVIVFNAVDSDNNATYPHCGEPITSRSRLFGEIPPNKALVTFLRDGKKRVGRNERTKTVDDAASLANLNLSYYTIKNTFSNNTFTSVHKTILLSWRHWWDTIPSSNKLKYIKETIKQ